MFLRGRLEGIYSSIIGKWQEIDIDGIGAFVGRRRRSHAREDSNSMKAFCLDHINDSNQFSVLSFKGMKSTDFTYVIFWPGALLLRPFGKTNCAIVTPWHFRSVGDEWEDRTKLLL